MPSKKLQLLSIGYVCALVIPLFPERMSMHAPVMSLPFNQDSCVFTFPQAQTQSPIGSRPRLHALPTKVTELTNLTDTPADASTQKSLQKNT